MLTYHHHNVVCTIYFHVIPQFIVFPIFCKIINYWTFIKHVFHLVYFTTFLTWLQYWFISDYFSNKTSICDQIFHIHFGLSAYKLLCLVLIFLWKQEKLFCFQQRAVLCYSHISRNAVTQWCFLKRFSATFGQSLKDGNLMAAVHFFTHTWVVRNF